MHWALQGQLLGGSWEFGVQHREQRINDGAVLGSLAAAGCVCVFLLGPVMPGLGLRLLPPQLCWEAMRGFPCPGGGGLPAASQPAQQQQALPMASLDVGRGPMSSRHAPWIGRSDPPGGLRSCSLPPPPASFFLPFMAAPSCRGEKKTCVAVPMGKPESRHSSPSSGLA